MPSRLRTLRHLVSDLPRYTKLTYCLVRDPRVPARNKAVLAGAMGLIVTPFVDVPLWVPVLGEMDAIALSLLAARLFVTAAPAEVVAEHERLISERRSRFDEDLRAGERVAVQLARRFRHDDDGGGQLPEHEYVGRVEPSLPAAFESHQSGSLSA